ncbi:hypothetical protein LguiA_014774 [Lonicera macranthoides]
MASVSPTWFYQDRGLSSMMSEDCFAAKKSSFHNLQTSFAGSFPTSTWQIKVGSSTTPRRVRFLPSIKCENTEKNEIPVERVTVERAPYYSYMDSTSGQMEPASGARAAIPGQDYWPEGTASRVRAAAAPEPTGVSSGSPSYGKNPGSRRKKNKASSVGASASSETSVVSYDQVEGETLIDDSEESKDVSEFVVYQTDPDKEELSEYELDKKLGRPHAFIDPKVKKEIKEPLTSEELWWQWRKSEKEHWSRWQRRRPDVETVFLKAMAKTGQVKLYGEIPTLTETALFRARRHIYKEERLQKEKETLESIGPIAYYSEWVEAWKRDTSREAVQKHFEETGEDENTQLIEMFTHQTDREYRVMRGTDQRIPRDPLAIRMPEEQIKQIWGGDPVYPTINYIQDPDEETDFRGPDFHEPTPEMLDYLKELGKVISREEMDKILAKEKPEEKEVADIDEAMARAVDIGENDDEGENSEAEDEKITRNWSVLKSTPEIRKSKVKPKKDGLSINEAIDDSENLTDFMMDFDEEEG